MLVQLTVLSIPANSPGFPGSHQVFHEISRSPGYSSRSPGNYLPWLFLHFLFINFVVLLLHWKKWNPKKKGPLIKMVPTLKIFGGLSPGFCWQVWYWVRVTWSNVIFSVKNCYHGHCRGVFNWEPENWNQTSYLLYQCYYYYYSTNLKL